MSEYSQAIIFGTICGTIARLYMLKSDYRQYPTYLHGRIVHLSLGFIAAGLGSLLMPAILVKDYTAVTFLTVAASQFRDVRNMERSTLTELDAYELVPRGHSYIEGIAIAFESRNYLVIMTAIITSSVYLTNNLYIILLGVAVGFFLCKVLMSGKTIKEICTIEVGSLQFKNDNIYISDIFLMNIANPTAQAELLKYGMGFLLTAKEFGGQATIANLGQRQAILHDASTYLGVYRDETTAHLVPMVRRDVDTGVIAVFLLPQIQNADEAIKIIGAVPILENALNKSHKARSLSRLE